MNMTLYRVGGTLRDSLMGRHAHDWDFAVEAESYEAMREGFLALGGRIWQERPQFLAIRGHLFGTDADFVLCRKDGAYTDGRRPDTVTPGTILDDLARRDFTVNAMASHTVPEDGMFVDSEHIIDPFGGQQDLLDRTLRAVGDPYVRFAEDWLRPVRALRFIATLDLMPDRALRQALSDHSVAYNVAGVAEERLDTEVGKMFQGGNTVRAVTVLAQYPPLMKALFSGRLRLRLEATLSSKR